MHVALRRAINTYLVPNAVGRMRPLMEAAAALVPRPGIETGTMDLVDDFTNPVPAVLTMDLVGLPLDDWAHYAEFFHGTIAYRPGQTRVRRAIANVRPMLARLGEEAEARRREPRGDLLSDLVTMEVGRPPAGRRRGPVASSGTWSAAGSTPPRRSPR